MFTKYKSESSYPLPNAQRNLAGRTHYVDSDTLRFHKSRILSARAVDNGLLFAIVESVALDMHNSKRGNRFVIFDIAGNVISRNSLENTWSRSAQAEKAMWKALDAIDAKQVTLDAIARKEKHFAQDIAEARAMVADIYKEESAA
tara:strand:+ start:305 stop:739 length:435 start_codon:yes stop_codon:yes gene_type:complete